MTDKDLLHISSSPHIRDRRTVTKIMLDVVIALIPALAVSTIVFGMRALFITFIAIVASLITEHFITVFLMKKRTTIGDLSAVVTGLLLAFNLPVAISPILAILGAVFAIAVAKMAFGGLGFNFINPALAGRAFLMASYPAAMTGAIFAQSGFAGKLPANLSGFNIDAFSGAGAIDGISQATPLAAIKKLQQIPDIDFLDLQEAFMPLFLGNVGGTIGETSALAILVGGIYLIYKRVINPLVPFIYIGGVFLLYWIFGGGDSFFSGSTLTIPTLQVLSGGIFLGAFFMLTDMTTTPITVKGQAIFAAGCAIITFIIREFGGYPEGCSYSILLMNLLTPLIDRYVKPKVYGTGGVK